ncbi:aminotransferase class V-fold PLP-dependent enzyme [Pontibacter sp. JH31]|uniref:Aminotransferase class V-fold PLP-dependent enzyme n=1 Tax=Pontibacter aquaedesilientis TaxID=2766980 RepID=A0ABR7XHG3_9BACT|nr:aminotransferase class V-fold PLP-dependent enzyme [Pontibacter aquaedesilientis]MBD1397725.1 aminotransferase class V-fold PLP-dependent enzyme [Pontibacter aquaedesilientis]
MRKLYPARSLLIWPTLPLDVYFRSNSVWKPFPLDQANCRVFSLARQAIWNTCAALGLHPNDTVLVPAYHHGSEIEALLQAGLQVRYYEVNQNLEPEPEELQSLMSTDVRALYIIHYLGFPQDAAFWRQWCDNRGILLIEDAAQALLATLNDKPVGSFGHMGVFCLYKTYGLPDGGAVIADFPPPRPTGQSNSGSWRVFKRHINWLATRRKELGYFHLMLKPIQTNLNRFWNRINKRIHKEFEVGDVSSPPTRMTKFLIPKIVDEKTADRRRENYRFLLKHLGDMVPAPFAFLPEGASPFAFPIEVNEPRDFLARLRLKGVMGLLFWLNPHPSLPVDEFPRSRLLREGVLALPVHQELSFENLQQIVDSVKEVQVNLAVPAIPAF